MAYLNYFIDQAHIYEYINSNQRKPNKYNCQVMDFFWYNGSVTLEQKKM